MPKSYFYSYHSFSILSRAENELQGKDLFGQKHNLKLVDIGGRIVRKIAGNLNSKEMNDFPQIERKDDDYCRSGSLTLMTGRIE